MGLPPGRANEVDRVWRLPDARIDPEHGAVFAEGRLRIEAALQRNGGAYRGWKGTLPDNPPFLAGRHLWGGTLFFHFGHFLTESLSRLWAAADSGARSILFTPKSPRGKQPEGPTPWQRAILDGLGVRLPLRILCNPVRVEELLVPAQGFGLGPLSGGSPAFRAFARGLRPPDTAAGTGKLYLSRSRLPGKTGSILGEAALERALEELGIRVFHPQDHPIADQIRVLAAARDVIGPEGSAFHLAGLVAAPQQRFALIRRRSGPDLANIAAHLRGMGAGVAVIDALAAEWLRPGRARADDMSWGEPDPAALSARLLALGLIDRPLDLGDRDHAAELSAIARQHKDRPLHRTAPAAGRGTAP